MTTSQELQQFQQMYHDGDIDGVAVVAKDGTRCATCGRFDQEVFHPAQLPPLPIDGCTGPNGCRCRYEANVVTAE